jgi:hypothetical protein
MKYQLVLQFSGSSLKDYDEMIELEETIIATLGDLGRVDGHDAGSGELNIFVHTDDPKRAFDRISVSDRAQRFMGGLRVAFREIGRDEYTVLFPEGISDFRVA